MRTTPTPLCRERADEPERHAHFGLGQRRRRLVEEKHPRVARHRLDDLHHLLEVVGQVAHHRVGIDVDLVLFQKSPRRPVHGPAPDDAEAVGRLVVEEEILGDRHGLHEIDVLMDRDDPLGERVVGAGEADHLAVERKGAGVRRIDPGDDLGERRLAGAVLADQPVHASRRD